MAKNKNFMVEVDPKGVMYTSINTSKDGYNSARMVVKLGDKQYLSVSFEWEGSGIPDFALDIMDFMKSNSIETAKVAEGMEEEVAAYKERHMKNDGPEYD